MLEIIKRMRVGAKDGLGKYKEEEEEVAVQLIGNVMPAAAAAVGKCKGGEEEGKVCDIQSFMHSCVM